MLTTYSFECEDCRSSFSIDMARQDYCIPRCIKCNSAKVYRDFCADQVLVKDASPRTIGALAEKNSSKKGMFR